jgi:uncharacterized protein YndB with AHSA1/START domain
MARFLDTIDLPLSCDAAFDALVDFSGTAVWDPSVVRARRLGSGAITPGARFRVVVRVLGIESALDYELIAAERPHRIVLRAERGPLTSLDEITLAPREGGTRVTYDARLTLAGPGRVLDPLLGAWFQRSGARSAEGLRRAFTDEPRKPAAAEGAHSVSARREARARRGAKSRKARAIAVRVR